VGSGKVVKKILFPAMQKKLENVGEKRVNLPK
jgi:hypothetical protein